MNLSAWSIQNPLPAIMLFVMLCFGGGLGFSAMKIQNLPDLDLPMVSVQASLPGATPSQLENDVARKLEDAVATVPGIKHIYTTLQDGTASLMLEFRMEKPVQDAVDDVRSAISRVQADLPGEMREPIVSRIDVSAQPIFAFTVSSPQMDAEALSWFVDTTLSRRLLAVRGVGAVNRVGGVTREIHVSLDPARLHGLQVSAAEISRQLRAMHSETVGGRANLGGAEQPVRTLGTVADAQALADMSISLSDGRALRLSQVARVSDGLAEPRSLALLDGKPVVGFEVIRSRGESEVQVGQAVQAALNELRAKHTGLQIVEAFNFVRPVEEEYVGSMQLLYEGALLAVVVVWLFLRDWRATFVSAIALPLSVIPAFLGMYWLGFSVNIVTLLALSLVVGVLVDDAIVEVENIVRHLNMGKSPMQAAREAADEIGLAVIATTLTLVAVFLPTAFMSGAAGKFFKQFGWTASLAVVASLLVARVLTPMMSAYFLRRIRQAHPEPRWMARYLCWAQWCIQHRGVTLLGATGFLIASLMLIPLLPTAFIPADDHSQTQVYLELAPGATLAHTHQAAEQARSLIQQIPQVRRVYTTIGAGSVGSDPFVLGSAGEVRKATLTILLSPRAERPRKHAVEEQIRQQLATLPGVRSKVGLGNSGEKYILALTGPDPLSLQAAARSVERELRTIPGLGNIASTASLVRPEIAVRPDFARAADLGVSSQTIGETLRVATLGDDEAALAKLNLAQRQVPILVNLEHSARSDLSVLSRLSVPGVHGPVSLGEVASLSLASGPAVISRYDRIRNINFEIELAGQPMGDVSALVAQLPAVRQLPAGVRMVEVGDAEVMIELFTSFGLAMLTGIVCIYLVLVLLFKDFFHPATILVALPLSLGGAFVGLLLGQQSFSMPSLIGLVMLMGIATKNSILLVEYAILARREHGMSRQAALLDACHKRARPIVMTTLAMGAGMLPIALGMGAADSSFRAPMAMAVLGGLLTSTVLSLLVAPAMFTYVDDMQQAILSRLRGWRARH